MKREKKTKQVNLRLTETHYQVLKDKAKQMSATATVTDVVTYLIELYIADDSKQFLDFVKSYPEITASELKTMANQAKARANTWSSMFKSVYSTAQAIEEYQSELIKDIPYHAEKEESQKKLL